MSKKIILFFLLAAFIFLAEKPVFAQFVQDQTVSAGQQADDVLSPAADKEKRRLEREKIAIEKKRLADENRQAAAAERQRKLEEKTKLAVEKKKLKAEEKAKFEVERQQIIAEQIRLKEEEQKAKLASQQRKLEEQKAKEVELQKQKEEQANLLAEKKRQAAEEKAKLEAERQAKLDAAAQERLAQEQEKQKKLEEQAAQKLSYKEKKIQEGYIVDLRGLVKKTKKQLGKVDQKIEEESIRRRNEQREAKVREYYSKAMLYNQDGQFEKARNLWEKAIQLTEHPEMKNYIEQKMQQSTKEEEDRLRRLAERSGYDITEIEAMYKDAVKLYKQKDFVNAKLKFETVKLYIEDYKAIDSYIMIIDQEIEFDQQKIIQEKLKDISKEAQAKKKQWHDDIEKKENAEKQVLAKEQAKELYAQGKELFALKNYSQARESFKRALALDPGLSESAVYLAKTDSKELQENKASAEEGARLDDAARMQQLMKDAEPLYQEALELYRKNDLSQARSRFDEIAVLYPKYKSTSDYIVKIDKKFEDDRLIQERARIEMEKRQKLEEERSVKSAEQKKAQEELLVQKQKDIEQKERDQMAKVEQANKEREEKARLKNEERLQKEKTAAEQQQVILEKRVAQQKEKEALLKKKQEEKEQKIADQQKERVEQAKAKEAEILLRRQEADRLKQERSAQLEQQKKEKLVQQPQEDKLRQKKDREFAMAQEELAREGSFAQQLAEKEALQKRKEMFVMGEKYFKATLYLQAKELFEELSALDRQYRDADIGKYLKIIEQRIKCHVQ